MSQSRDGALAQDRADMLAPLRQRFAQPHTAQGRPCTYLCGHSLGLMPLAARALLAAELDDWARLGVLGHENAQRPWITYHDALAAPMAELLGCDAEEVVVMNSLSVNLQLLLASFYQPAGVRRRILIEAGAFPSDRYAVMSHLRWHGCEPRTDLIELAPRDGEDLIREADVEAALQRDGERIALVLWPGVQYLTGQAFDLARIARAAHAVGALAGFDLAHAVGNMPFPLRAGAADFAVWCSYKYLNAGPGALGGCFVHRRHFDSARPRLVGWWGHDLASRFDMPHDFRAAVGAAGFQVSNQSVLAAAPLVASLALFREAGMERLRRKSVALGAYFEQLIAQRTPQVRVMTPRDVAARGAQFSLRIDGDPMCARRVLDGLRTRGVICDWRAPDIIRAALTPLYNGFVDVFDFVENLAASLQEA
jgi:kynureninase